MPWGTFSRVVPSWLMTMFLFFLSPILTINGLNKSKKKMFLWLSSLLAGSSSFLILMFCHLGRGSHLCHAFPTTLYLIRDFFSFRFFAVELNMKALSCAHIQADLFFLILSQYLAKTSQWESVYFSVSMGLICKKKKKMWRVHFSVYYKYIAYFSLLLFSSVISLKLMSPDDWMWWNK